MRISDWSSDVCSSDLQGDKEAKAAASVLGQALDLLREGKPARLTRPKDDEEARLFAQAQLLTSKPVLYVCNVEEASAASGNAHSARVFEKAAADGAKAVVISAAIEAEIVQMDAADRPERSEEHTSELQSLMRISYAVFCLKKKKK